MAVINSLKPIAIVVAVKREGEAVLKTLSLYEIYVRDGQTFCMCSYRNKRIVLVTTGIGIENARQGADILIQEYSPSAIISVGYAGAVVAHLKKGNVILGEKICYKGNPEKIFFSDQKLLFLSEKSLKQHDVPYQNGKIVTVDKVLGTAELKKKFGKDFRCEAVDMESAALAEAAREKGIPFLALRVVLDEVGHNLRINPDVISKNGKLSILRILKAFIVNFAYISDFIRLISAWRVSDRAIQISLATILDGISGESQKTLRGNV